MKTIKTVGELKDFIKDFPDDTPIVNYENDLEKRGYFNSTCFSLEKMQQVTKQTWDRFDGIDYTYEAYERSDDGVECLIII